MARVTGSRDQSQTLDAGTTWIQKCLISDQALFSPEGVWTASLCEGVKRAFVDHPDQGSDDFITKLTGQMRRASPAAQQLMAEMLWALLLFPANIKPSTKRQQIQEIWQLSGRPIPGGTLLSDDVLEGVGNAGQGYNNYRPLELEFLIGLTGDLKGRDPRERQHILDDYDAFVTWIEAVPQGGKRQFRHMLRYFAFPDQVERMASNRHRRQVLAAFENVPEKESKKWSDKELDEALLALRRKLEAETPGAIVDFYKNPWRLRWEAAEPTKPPEEEQDQHNPRYWIEKTITYGRPDRLNGEHALGKALWSPQRDQRGADIYRFMREVKAGDIILHLTDNTAFTGVSVAESGYQEFEGVPGSEWSDSGKHYRIPLRDFRELSPPLNRDVFFASPTKEKLIALLDQGQKNAFYNSEPSLNQGAYLTPASPMLVAALQEAYKDTTGKSMIDRPITEPETGSAIGPAIVDLRRVADEFSNALEQSRVTFGAGVVRAFVSSLATKPFVILTGLSGSGKTQLALKFGEWLGVDRLQVIPVRPDWTGAEALFGYENALLPRKDGRAAWHVPSALRFMLRAAADLRAPYLLVLDEMNLAHVERYFADFLSGMESEKPCLPNLSKESDGEWRVTIRGDVQIRVPRNLFVIGTVNVDETTYMFSPKVLDRSNTFEFRVATDDLRSDASRPQTCTRGDWALVRGFLGIAQDNQWQSSNPAPDLQSFEARLRELHGLLLREGFEFGHRVFYEAIRFASMLASAGDPDPMTALDRQIMQKILPRLHGSRRRLESTLSAVGRFCFDLGVEGADVFGRGIAFDPLAPPTGEARLPASFDKIKRMMRILRQNQFASFTE